MSFFGLEKSEFKEKFSHIIKATQNPNQLNRKAKISLVTVGPSEGKRDDCEGRLISVIFMTPDGPMGVLWPLVSNGCIIDGPS